MSSPFDALPGLARRLTALGRPTDAGSLAELLQGLAAAPESLAGPEWLELVAPPTADAALREDLQAARAACARGDERVAATKAESAARLAALRAELAGRGLGGFIVPRADEHQGEYVPLAAQRLAWLTGFQGSAGTAVVLPEEAAIFTDGRYTLQVRQQVDGAHWSYQSVPETSVAAWLKGHAGEGARIGYDPWLHTRDWVRKASEALSRRS